jgi:uncharacterized protein YjbJ (UPF0337 family)
MNWDRIQGEWKQLTSQVKTKWAKLTDDDMAMMGAKKDELVGKIQERYGILRDEAEKQVDEWMSKLPSHGDAKHAQGQAQMAGDHVKAAGDTVKQAGKDLSPKH